MSLYQNENVVLWNPETDKLEEFKLAQEENEIQQGIEEGRSFSQLKQHNGFILLQTYLLTTVEDLKHKLSYETDYKKFRRLQEAVKAYTNVLTFVDFKIQEGLALEQTRQTPSEG